MPTEAKASSLACASSAFFTFVLDALAIAVIVFNAEWRFDIVFSKFGSMLK